MIPLFEQRKVANQCIQCGGSKRSNRLRCAKHLIDQTKAAQKKREKYKETGRCPDCSRPALPNKVRCYCVAEKNEKKAYHDEPSRGNYGIN